jgi:hypothetical protein
VLSLLVLNLAPVLAGPYDTTELVVLSQPTAVVVTWRPTPALYASVIAEPANCLVSVTVADKGNAVFNTASCDPDTKPLFDLALQSAKARPVEEMGWGLKTWTTLRVSLTPRTQGLAVQIRPGGFGERPELHMTELDVRERSEPIYPADMLWDGIPGICHVHVQIDPKGRPTKTLPLLCTTGFETSSNDALKQWRFKPHRVDGTPVIYDTVISLNYTPNDATNEPQEETP